MGKVYERLDERLRAFIAEQPMFFVATAPDGADGADGHVNVSPKGYTDTLAVLDDHTIAYLDLEGSGVETIAHVRQNGRITLMFCAFTGKPLILRLYGTARVSTPDSADWMDLIAQFGPHPGVRTVIVVEIDRIADACGWGVPEMTPARDRGILDSHALTPGSRGRRAERAAGDRASIDGIDAVRAGETDPANQHS